MAKKLHDELTYLGLFLRGKPQLIAELIQYMRLMHTLVNLFQN